MVFNFRKRRETHVCHLQKEDQDEENAGLPQCDPGANALHRGLHRLRRLILPSFGNTQTRFYIRSHPALIAERKRHCRSRGWFVIHPLSLLTFYRQAFMTAVLIVSCFAEPFFCSFGVEYLLIWVILSMFYVLDVFINFIHGYIDSKTQEMILDVRSIVRRYVLSFFVVDVLSLVILPTCMTATNSWHINWRDRATNCGRWGMLQALFRVFRMPLAFRCLNRAVDYFGFGNIFTTIVGIIIKTLYLLHLFACINYSLNTYLTYSLHYNNTFLHIAGLMEEQSLQQLYIVTLQETCCLFFRTCAGVYPVRTMEERMFKSLLMLVGIFYFAYVVVQVYDVVNVQEAVGNKFEEIEHQLKEYMVQRKLPGHLRRRISRYYHHRFEQKYFRESFILDTLSEHLRYEIVLFTCMPLVQKASFFKRLPTTLIGQMMTAITREVFLHNDVVFRCGDTPDKMYFITSGTVAFFTEEGVEFIHYQDGDTIGELQIVQGGQRQFSAVSVEITETYTLTYHDLRRYMRPYPQFWSMLKNKIKKEHQAAQNDLEKVLRGGVNEYYDIKDTLYYL